MIVEIDRIITIFIIPGLLLGMSVCFFFLSIPEKVGLHNYRIARKVMGLAYFFFAVGIFSEHYFLEGKENLPFSQLITIIVSCIQAFLFTYTLVTLINIRYITSRKVFREILLIVVFSGVMLVLYTYISTHLFQIFIYLIALFYLVLLVRYVSLFRREYHDYVARMDSFFANDENHRLHWVSLSFYTSLGIGIFALIYGLYPTPIISLIFMVTAVIFYAMFGIRFINYAFAFQTFEAAIEQYEDESKEMKETLTEEINSLLMEKIDALMKDRELYKNSNISVDKIASILGEKNRNVSAAINCYRKKNFKTYINEYRVAEAVRLLSEDKKNRLTVDAIAFERGFTDRSNFYRVFKKHKGTSPTDFRNM